MGTLPVNVDILPFQKEDQLFSRTIVPMEHYHKDQRVPLLMVEINRWLYLGEDYSVDSERVEILIEVLKRVGGR